MLAIPRLAFEDKTAAQGMELLLREFRMKYPHDDRIRGLAVGRTFAQQELLTSVDLKNIPLGEAVQVIADLTWRMWDLRSGAIELLPATPPEKMSATLVKSLPDHVSRNLGNIRNVADVRELFRRLKIREAYIEDVQFYAERQMLKVRGTATELKILESVIEMAARGVKL